MGDMDVAMAVVIMDVATEVMEDMEVAMVCTVVDMDVATEAMAMMVYHPSINSMICKITSVKCADGIDLTTTVAEVITVVMATDKITTVQTTTTATDAHTKDVVTFSLK